MEESMNGKMIRSFLKNDLRQIIREPLMLMLLILPAIIIVVFAVLKSLWPWVDSLLTVNISPYEPYIGVMAIMIQPMLIGSVLGFLMLDEKDAKILQLLVVTPIGFIGYLTRRSMLPILSNVIFIVITFIALEIKLSILSYMMVLIFCTLESLLVGFLLMSFAEDKIKGLALAKGVGALFVFGFADLIPVKSLQTIAYLVPYYWNTQLMIKDSMLIMGLGLLVHIIYLLLIIRRLRTMVY